MPKTVHELYTHLREVSYVEGVMYLGRRGQHLITHPVVDGDAAADEREESILDLWHEVSLVQELAQLHLVDVLEVPRGGRGQRQHAVT